MTQLSEYFVNNFNLRLSSKGLVVQVKEMNGNPPRRDQLEDLPDWIFRSNLAIWFLEGDSSIYRRAVAGEKVKHELMMELAQES
ncbi:MAG TPA: hypothetical protein VLH08_23135 [Acidobacteriota bacterium]|jgi:hypothetical protein|nr:hypothetical protein [Acidobacteriota bacterium]